MKRRINRVVCSFFSLLSLYFLLSCGLEAFYYIDYIPDGTYVNTASASIRLPSGSDEGYNSYFTNFVIFYRIYISDQSFGAKIEGTLLSSINPTLATDYNSIYNSLEDKTSTSVTTSNLENNFLNRNYFSLGLVDANGENISINSVLGSGSLGKTLEIAFPPNTGVQPTLRLDGGTAYTLRRAVEAPGINFTPKPDTNELYRTFLNHPELYNNANATPEINRDTVRNNTGQRYTYVSMYIAATGISLEMPPRPIFSQPTFLGIFLLAESS